MADKKNCFYQDCDKGKKKKKKKKKYPKSDRVERSGNRWIGRRGGWIGLGHSGDHDHGGDMGGGDGGGMGESFSAISEIFDGALPASFSANVHTATKFNDDREFKAKKPRLRRLNKRPSMTGEEDAEVGQVGVAGGANAGNKIDQARQLFQSIINQPNMTRGEVIQRFQDNVGVTNSTAVSYYERLAKEAGLTNQDDKQELGQGVDMGRGPMMSTEPVEQLPADTDNELEDLMGDFDDPDRAGVIRTVDNAHLVYKRQTEDGSFEELWIYNIGNSMNDELEIRRDILAGTDIKPKTTTSEDGKQQYFLTTLGNAQYVNIRGLPN